MNKNESKYFYTASLFDEALIELLSKKDIEYITVKEICAKAGVNRSTFYLHYESIYDLLNETIDYIDKKFNDKISDNRKIKDINIASLKDLIYINDEYLIPYLEYIRENKKVFIANYNNPQSMNAIERKNELEDYIIKPILKRFNISEKDIKYYCAFYINGLSAILSEWIKNDCKDNLDDILRVIKECVRPNYENY